MDKIPGEELMKTGIETVGKELVEGVVLPIANPAAQASGHALGTLMNVFNLLLAPLERAQIRSQDKTDRLRKKLAEGFEEIPPERRVEPPLEIIGPALETLKYVEDETLQDMFAKLLLSAMDSEKQRKAHKAFVKIIEELSPYDAWLLEKIHVKKYDVAIKHAEILFRKQQVVYFYSSFVPHSLFDDEYVFNEANCNKAERSMDNLVRLKMINLKRANDHRLKNYIFDDLPFFNEDTFYYDFYGSENFVVHVREVLAEKGTFSMEEILDFLETSTISISRFGLDFCSTCIK